MLPHTTTYLVCIVTLSVVYASWFLFCFWTLYKNNWKSDNIMGPKKNGVSRTVLTIKTKQEIIDRQKSSKKSWMKNSKKQSGMCLLPNKRKTKEDQCRHLTLKIFWRSGRMSEQWSWNGTQIKLMSVGLGISSTTMPLITSGKSWKREKSNRHWTCSLRPHKKNEKALLIYKTI